MTEVQKKGTGKGVVIALGVLVVILAVSTGYVYSSLQSQINALNTDKTNLQNQVSSLTTDKNNLQSEFNSLNTTYQNYISTHTYTNTQYSSLNTTYQNYKTTHSHTDSEYNLLNDIVNLDKSTVLVNSQTISQPANSYTYWTFSASYAGYISVNVESSTTTNTFVEVVYTSHGVNYDERITVGTSGTAAFPVLPSNNIQVRVGNTNLISGATETVTVTYHY